MKADPTLLQMKYADVISCLAKTAHISLDDALKRFYESQTYLLMREGISDMHCMSIPYLVESILLEQQDGSGK